MSSFFTLKRESEALLKEKGSKFLAYAFPIIDVADSKGKLESVQSIHPKARHFCSALRIGLGDDEYYLTNDDGEPANSAGAPILGQLRSFNITNAYIIVVRYFGGTKLGVGGLISAYKEVTALAIKENKIIEQRIKKNLVFEVNYSVLGDVLAVIDKNNLNVEMENLDSKAIVTLVVEEEKLDQTKALFDRFNLIFLS